MRNLEELQRKQRECTINVVSLTAQFDGVLKLYEAMAIQSAMHPMLGSYAEQLHSLLDNRLDNMRACLEYTRQIVDFQNRS